MSHEEERRLNVNLSLEDVKREILESISQKILEITGGGIDTPVHLRHVYVTDNRVVSNGSFSTLQLQCIYLDEGGKLSGDFTCSVDGMNGGMVFGKALENLYIEDLQMVMKNLGRSQWHVVEGDDSEWDRLEKKMNGGIFRFARMKEKLLRKGA